jgi:phosphonate transport system substrate-binding protein
MMLICCCWCSSLAVPFIVANLVRADSRIQSLKDLQGKRFSFVDPASTSGHLYPKTLLFSKGFDPKIFFGKSVFAGSHNALVLSI